MPTFHDDKPCTAVLVLDSVGNVLLGNQAREPMPSDDAAELRWFPLDGLPAKGQLTFKNTSEALELLGR